MQDFFSRTIIKSARKEHKCEMCSVPIHKGEGYEREFGRYEGNLFSRCYHTECSGIISDYIYDAQDNEYDYGEITDWWRCNYCNSCKNADENLDCDYTDGGVMDRVCWCTHYEKREKKPVEDPLIPKDAGDRDYSGLLDE